MEGKNGSLAASPLVNLIPPLLVSLALAACDQGPDEPSLPSSSPDQRLERARQGERLQWAPGFAATLSVAQVDALIERRSGAHGSGWAALTSALSRYSRFSGIAWEDQRLGDLEASFLLSVSFGVGDALEDPFGGLNREFAEKAWATALLRDLERMQLGLVAAFPGDALPDWTRQFDAAVEQDASLGAALGQGKSIDDVAGMWLRGSARDPSVTYPMRSVQRELSSARLRLAFYD